MRGLDDGSLQIRTHTMTADNNWGEEYRFVLSVLGKDGSDVFLPLLAIALEADERGGDRWLAVWNLGSEGAPWPRHIGALLPAYWSPRGATPPERIVSELDFPQPDLVSFDHSTGAHRRLARVVSRLGARLVGLERPLRFGLHSYTYFRDDADDRRFHQLYTKIRLYSEVSRLSPSPEHLSFAGVSDLLYQLLINRRPLGFLMDEDPIYSAVTSFEGERRTHMTQVASHLHSQANLYHLGYEEVRYGLPGRPAVSYAAVLYLRGSDLPRQLPDWPANNPFDLTYNPYEHPEIRLLAREYPDEKIPLAFFVLPSDFNLKPVIAADFFSPRNPSRREATGVLRIGLEHFLAIYRIPIMYRIFTWWATYRIGRTDATHFSNRSTAAGIEPARIFGRLDWHFNQDTNHLLLSALEQRIANPLTESFRRESATADLQYRRLLSEDKDDLSRFLRRLHEDEVRSQLDLEERAVFEEDYRKYLEERATRDGLLTVRRFNRAEHLSAYDWQELLEAWKRVEALDPNRRRSESQRFLARLQQLHPNAIPETYRTTVREILDRPVVSSIVRLPPPREER